MLFISDADALDSLFDDPKRDSRLVYAQYWQNKLKESEYISFPDDLATSIADKTEGFSFAYLKEILCVPSLCFRYIDH